jgi:hypothetical protein
MTPPAGGPPVICAEDEFEALLRWDRTILSIEARPERPALSRLPGERGGGRLRQVLREAVPDELGRATPLYLILDDISGTSLVAGWAWTQWDPDWLANIQTVMSNPEIAKAFATREGVCIGFAPGASVLSTESTMALGSPVPDLRHPEDPEGWHEFPAREEGIAMRRARRIDVRLDDVIVIDAAFQDSATTPAGGRAAVHEYSLTMTADPTSLTVLSLHAEPRILPQPECPSATANLSRLLGTKLPALRENVFAELKGTAGCTHLNDALRALADVPALLAYLHDPNTASATSGNQ